MDSDINLTTLELVRLRASQLFRKTAQNETYVPDPKATEEKEQCLDQLKGWRKSSRFSQRERAALALCEAIVLHPTEHVPAKVLRYVQVYFSKEQLVSLTLTILSLINWNPLSASHFLGKEPSEKRPNLHRIE